MDEEVNQDENGEAEDEISDNLAVHALVDPSRNAKHH